MQIRIYLHSMLIWLYLKKWTMLKFESFVNSINDADLSNFNNDYMIILLNY